MSSECPVPFFPLASGGGGNFFFENLKYCDPASLCFLTLEGQPCVHQSGLTFFFPLKMLFFDHQGSGNTFLNIFLGVISNTRRSGFCSPVRANFFSLKMPFFDP